jgi:hypothetical protein
VPLALRWSLLLFRLMALRRSILLWQPLHLLIELLRRHEEESGMSKSIPRLRSVKLSE